MGRVVATLACLSALAAGCGGDEPRAGGGGVAGARVERSPAARERAWATRAEVAWLARVAAWNAGFADAGAAVARFEAGTTFDLVLRGEERAVADYAEVLEPVRRCGESFATEVGKAPTARLRESERNFRDTCAHYARGVELMLRAVDEQEDGLAARARSQIEEAGKEGSVAAGTLPPGEKQPLLTARGGAASRVDRAFSEAAALVADKLVEARCWAAADWARLMVEERAYTRGKVTESVLGFASAGGERINLAPGICRGLGQLAYGDARPTDEDAVFALALSVATLAHESVHASGVAAEATAECDGIQWLERAAAALGVEDGYATRLRDVYWSRYDRLPAMYRSDGCRDGGELDLNDGSSRFP
jgi:hypothetical protein